MVKSLTNFYILRQTVNKEKYLKRRLEEAVTCCVTGQQF